MSCADLRFGADVLRERLQGRNAVLFNGREHMDGAVLRCERAPATWIAEKRYGRLCLDEDEMLKAGELRLGALGEISDALRMKPAAPGSGTGGVAVGENARAGSRCDSRRGTQSALTERRSAQEKSRV